MTTRHRALGLSPALLLTMLISTAHAQDVPPPEGDVMEGVAVEGEGLPLPYAQRPLTLTEGTLRGDAAFSIAHISFTTINPITGMEETFADTAIALILGAGFGIMDDLEVGATVLPLQLDPEVDYLDPSVYGIFRFLRGNVEVGAGLAFVFPVQGDFGIVPAIPVDIHIGDNMLLGTGVRLPILFADPDPIVSLEIPAEFAINVMPSLFFEARTGFLIPDFDFDFFTIPLGIAGGYTIASGTGGPLADVTLAFGFPAFLQPASDGDAVVTNLWTLVLGASFYFDVM
jgi:hypothetical protein